MFSESLPGRPRERLSCLRETEESSWQPLEVPRSPRCKNPSLLCREMRCPPLPLEPQPSSQKGRNGGRGGGGAGVGLELGDFSSCKKALSLVSENLHGSLSISGAGLLGAPPDTLHLGRTPGYGLVVPTTCQHSPALPNTSQKMYMRPSSIWGGEKSALFGYTCAQVRNTNAKILNFRVPLPIPQAPRPPGPQAPSPGSQLGLPPLLQATQAPRGPAQAREPKERTAGSPGSPAPKRSPFRNRLSSRPPSHSGSPAVAKPQKIK